MNEAPMGAQAEQATSARRTRSPRSPAQAGAVRANEIRAVQLPSHAPQANSARPLGDRAKLFVPNDIANHFIKVSERDYHFRNGEHAFTRRDYRLTTRSGNAQLVAALVSILEANGARAVAVSGTQQFRQRAWRAAVSSGLSVQGYTPTAFEAAKYLTAAPAAERSMLQPTSASADDTPSPAKPKTPSGELLVGELLDHGRARESSDSKAPMSYYVKLGTDAGERTVWGRDLERALEASRTKPQIGNTIGVRALTSDQLLFKREEVPSQNPVRSATHDPFFIVEKSQFFAMRAAAATIFRDHDIPSDKAIARYPELAGAYALLKVAVRTLARDVPRPVDRFTFLLSMRQELAPHIERGEPIPTFKELDRLLGTSSVTATPKTREPMVRS